MKRTWAPAVRLKCSPGPAWRFRGHLLRLPPGPIAPMVSIREWSPAHLVSVARFAFPLVICELAVSLPGGWSQLMLPHVRPSALPWPCPEQRDA